MCPLWIRINKKICSLGVINFPTVEERERGGVGDTERQICVRGEREREKNCTRGERENLHQGERKGERENCTRGERTNLHQGGEVDRERGTKFCEGRGGASQGSETNL